MQRLPEIVGAAVLALLLTAAAAPAATISVAVASNFLRPLAQLTALFTRDTGIGVQHTGSSTGRLYAQINSGAPYDLFLAADGKRPDLLHKAGLAEAPMVYARGEVVLWTRDSTVAAADWQQALAAGRGRIAIAAPGVAPYGDAADAALHKAGLRTAIASRLVFAQTAGQAFQYAEQGATAFGFVPLAYALSEAGTSGRHWPIPQAGAVVQKGCVLQRSAQRPLARRFLDFLQTPAARAVIAAYGYRQE